MDPVSCFTPLSPCGPNRALVSPKDRADSPGATYGPRCPDLVGEQPYGDLCPGVSPRPETHGGSAPMERLYREAARRGNPRLPAGKRQDRPCPPRRRKLGASATGGLS